MNRNAKVVTHADADKRDELSETTAEEAIRSVHADHLRNRAEMAQKERKIALDTTFPSFRGGLLVLCLLQVTWSNTWLRLKQHD